MTRYPADPAAPLVVVDLDRADATMALPPVPVIGIGDRAHPLAPSLDAVIEPPVTLDMMVAQVERQPQAAAALVQLLRATEGMAAELALVLESIAFAMLQGSAGHAAWLAGQPRQEPVPPGRLVVTRDDATLRLVTDRPGGRNAIDRTMRDALYDAFAVAALDDEITRVEWRATGRAFGMGADLAEFGTTRDPATAHAIRQATLPAHMLARRAEIVAVHVQGACVGSSLELAAFAGRVTAERSAWFRLPEVAMGIIPGAGGCVSVPRRIGRQRAALLMLSGRRIDAVTALRWGLIDAVMDLPSADPGGADPD